MTLQLEELHDSNDLLDNPRALQDRYERDGCLFTRCAIDPSALFGVTDAATPLLVQCGVATTRSGLRWTGAAMPHIDDTGLNEDSALSDLVEAVDAGTN